MGFISNPPTLASLSENSINYVSGTGLLTFSPTNFRFRLNGNDVFYSESENSLTFDPLLTMHLSRFNNAAIDANGDLSQSWNVFANNNGTIQSRSGTVASLPAAGTAGRMRFVTDSNTAVFNAIVAAGGANKVLVVDDGANWRVG